jgi:hypothetical protein
MVCFCFISAVFMLCFSFLYVSSVAGASYCYTADIKERQK